MAADGQGVMAFDFGEKRIGVAVGETALGIAHPLKTVDEEATAPRFAAIAALIAEWKPQRLVVGLPCHADGTEHELSRLCRRFAHRLEGRFNLPVDLVDERLTSAEAESLLRDSGADLRRGGALDAVAAQRILQAWFDARARAGKKS